MGFWWLFCGEVGLVSGGLVGAMGLGCWWLMVRLGCWWLMVRLGCGSGSSRVMLCGGHLAVMVEGWWVC